MTPQATVGGLLPNQAVTVVSAQWYGADAVELTFKTPAGRVANQLLTPSDEPRPAVVESREASTPTAPSPTVPRKQRAAGWPSHKPPAGRAAHIMQCIRDGGGEQRCRNIPPSEGSVRSNETETGNYRALGFVDLTGRPSQSARPE